MTLCFFAACGKDAPPPPKGPPPPLRVEWHGARFDVVGDPAFRLSGMVQLVGRDLRFSYDNAELGLVTKVDDRPVNFAKPELAAPFLFGSASPSQRLEKLKLDSGAALTFSIPDGRTATTKLPVLDGSVPEPAAVFAEVSEGHPMIFSGEGPDTTTPDAAVRLATKREAGSVIGKPALFRDVDWVAVVALKDVVKTAECKFTGDLGRQTTITNEGRNTEVSLVDRRTGAVVDRTVLPPGMGCPSNLTRDKFDESRLVSGAFGVDIDAWIAKRLGVTP